MGEAYIFKDKEGKFRHTRTRAIANQWKEGGDLLLYTINGWNLSLKKNEEFDEGEKITQHSVTKSLLQFDVSFGIDNEDAPLGRLPFYITPKGIEYLNLSSMGEKCDYKKNKYLVSFNGGPDVQVPKKVFLALNLATSNAIQ